MPAEGNAAVDDVVLVQRVAEGDAEALRMLYERLGRIVYSFAVRHTDDPGLAEVHTRDAFLALWRRAGTFDPDHARHAAWLLANAGVVTAPEGSAPADSAQSVAETFAGLPPDQREVVSLAYFEHLSHARIAATIGAPLGTVRGRMKLALERLRSGEQTQGTSGQRAIFAALETSLPRVAPPAGLLDRVLDETRGEAPVVPLHARPRGAVSLTAGTIAVTAAVLGLAIGLTLVSDAGLEPAARAVLEDRAGLGVSGEALLYDPDGDGGYVTVSLRNLLPAPPDHHYEVWVLPAGSDEPISLGMLDPRSLGDVALRYDLPAPGAYATVDVSIEDDGGPPERSDASLAKGAFG